MGLFLHLFSITYPFNLPEGIVWARPGNSTAPRPGSPILSSMILPPRWWPVHIPWLNSLFPSLSHYKKPFANHGAGICTPTKLGDSGQGQMLGVHIPAPWFAYGEWRGMACWWKIMTRLCTKILRWWISSLWLHGFGCSKTSARNQTIS